ncbi:MAG: enoyl-CoA hydratase/isomerase family protein [Rubrivivax sp.]|nr:enoyl-CoA hydratase/isomerase family protein [Rubrivivax sp.]
MHDETLAVEQGADGVARVTLNRPGAKNALSGRMADELTAAMRALGADEAVRAIVLTGAGGDFCAGGDVKDMGAGGPRTPEQRRAAMGRYRELALVLLGLEKPLVAALDGVAYGAGLSIALTADLVLVSTRVRCAMVFHRIGLVPDVAAWYTLPRIVGLQRAKELIYSAREFGAEEALRMGLALEVLAPEALQPRALELARGLAAGPATAFSLSKRALNASLNSELGAMLDLEATAQAVAASSDFAREAVRRFVAREPAAFRWPAPPASNTDPKTPT